MDLTQLNKMKLNKDELSLLAKMENKSIAFINGWQIYSSIYNKAIQKTKASIKKEAKEETVLLINSLNTHIRILDEYRYDMEIMRNKIEKYESFIKQSMLIFK